MIWNEVKTKDKIQYALIGVFIYITLDAVYNHLIFGRIGSAIVTYSLVPLFVWGGMWVFQKIRKEMTIPKFWKFYVSWMVIPFSDRVNQWSRE